MCKPGLFLGCLLLAFAGLAAGQDGDRRNQAEDEQQPFELTKTQALQDDKEDHVIAVAEDTGFVYTGGRKLSQLNKDLVPLREYTPAVDTTFTALITDAEHVFAATANKEVLKLRRSDLSLVATFSGQLGSKVKAMAQNDDALFLSLATTLEMTQGTVVRLAKKTMTQTHSKHIVNEGNAMIVDATHVYIGTWGTPATSEESTGATATVLALSPANLSDQMPAQTMAQREFVSVEQDTNFLYFGTDNVNVAENKWVVKVSKTDLSFVAAQGLSGESMGACVSMTSDAENLWCGTNAPTGQVVKIRKADLGQDGAVVATVTSASNGSQLYALAHVGSTLVAASYSDKDAKVLLFTGYLQPQDCEMSQWSSWGTECVNYWTKDVVACGGGVNLRQREVRKKAAWGGAACGPTLDPRDCMAEQAECCHGDLVWSNKMKKGYVCDSEENSDEIMTLSAPACVCPLQRPRRIGTSCMAAASCAKHKCVDITCNYLEHSFDKVKDPNAMEGAVGHRIVVHHKNKEKRTANGFFWDEKHHCSYEDRSRFSQCTCYCWDKLCSEDADCGGGPKVCKDGKCAVEYCSEDAHCGGLKTCKNNPDGGRKVCWDPELAETGL